MTKDNLFWDLSYVALNRGYNAHALRVAYSNDGLDLDDRRVLLRYLEGRQNDMDHIRLQIIAIKLKESTQ
jgi:hypothetical protein